MEISYTLTMTNADGGWDPQFSYDEQGMPGLYLFYWLVFSILLAVHLYFVRLLWTVSWWNF